MGFEMKVLFLDVDGVLNKLPHDKRFGDFDKEAMVNLEMLLNKVKDLKIVVSSAWRTVGLNKLKDTFKSHGIDPNRILATTGNETSEERTREFQILRWLTKHPEIRKFVIFDDSKEFEVLKPHLVKIKASVGLTQRNVEKAIEILDDSFSS